MSSGIRVKVKLKPNTLDNRVLGVAQKTNGSIFVRVSVTAAPENYSANGAIIEFLSKQ